MKLSLYNFGKTEFFSLNYPYDEYKKSSLNEFTIRNHLTYFLKEKNEQNFVIELNRLVDSLGIKYISGGSIVIPTWVEQKASSILRDPISNDWFAKLK
jgi:hypothetical protein